MYQGGDQSGEWGNVAFIERNIRGHGSTHGGRFDDLCGDVFPGATGTRNALKEGDSPTMLYLLSPIFGGVGDVDDPTQGMNFCALHAITGERRYLSVAERAARFLLDNWQVAGRPIHYHHCEDRQQVHDVTAFGDIYYYHEAILWVWHWTADEELKDDIRRVYAWHIKGAEGLLQALENGVWWPVGHVWTNAKAAAMPLVLIEYARSMADDAEVNEAVRRCIAFLCAPEFASRIGVMCDPGAPWGDFGASSTGFGGLALAERIEPGVIYLKAKHGRPRKRQAELM